jgi:hypothetical protein
MKEQKDNKDGVEIVIPHDFWDDHFEVMGFEEKNEKVKQQLTKKLQGKFDKLEKDKEETG